MPLETKTSQELEINTGMRNMESRKLSREISEEEKNY